MSHGRPRRDLNFFYPSAEYTGYSREKSDRRFSVLHSIPDLGRKSLLDIGSGKCNLFTWLRDNGYSTQYDAVDIREDSLRLCPCPPTHTHTGVPTGEWDIICLFGTVTFNIGSDRDKNKNILKNLLLQSIDMKPKHIVFTVIRGDGNLGIAHPQLISFGRDELDQLIHIVSPSSSTVYEDLDTSEWIVRCDFE